MYSYKPNFPRIPLWAPAVVLPILYVLIGTLVHSNTATELFTCSETTARALKSTPNIPSLILNATLAGLSIWLLNACIGKLGRGARRQSRILFQVAGLGLCPFFIAGIFHGTNTQLAVILVLSGVYILTKILEKPRVWLILLMVLLAILGVWLKPFWAGLFVGLLHGVAYHISANRFGNSVSNWLLALAVLIYAVLLPESPLWVSTIGCPETWSINNYMALANWGLGFDFEGLRIALLAFPFIHPAFNPMLPALFFLSPSSDWALPSRNILAFAGVCQLAFGLGYSPFALETIFPSFLMLLLFLFSAWDRFISYGRFFFPNLTHLVLGIAVLLQITLCIWYLT